MIARIALTNEYLRQHFTATGEMLSSVVDVPIPVTDLPPETRAQIASLTLSNTLDVTNPNGYSSAVRHAVPASLEEWQALIAECVAYEAEQKTKREAAKDAEFERMPLGRLRELSALNDEELEQHARDTIRYRNRFEVPPVYNSDQDRAGFAEAVQLSNALRPRMDTAIAQAKAKLDAEQEAGEARGRAEREAAEAEKKVWVEAHGSEHLRRAYAAGYDCQRKYVTERAALEFPGYTVDFGGRAEWKSRSCPSEAALDESERIGGTVVWLTAPPETSRTDWAEAAYEYEPHEVVVVQSFLGRYTLLSSR